MDLFEAYNKIKDLVAKLPDAETLRKVSEMAPLLQRMPSDQTLRDLIKLAPLLERIPSDATLRDLSAKIPDKKTQDEWVARLRDVFEFIEAFKAPAGDGRKT